MPAAVQPSASSRRFAVHAASEGRHRFETVYGDGHEDAAVGYVERCSPAPDDDGALTVIVTDCESGQEHCYRIDLGTGETAPCD